MHTFYFRRGARFSGFRPWYFPGAPGILPVPPGIIPGRPGILPGAPGILAGPPGILSGAPGILPGPATLLFPTRCFFLLWLSHRELYPGRPDILPGAAGNFTRRMRTFYSPRGACFPGVHPWYFTRGNRAFYFRRGSFFFWRRAFYPVRRPGNSPDAKIKSSQPRVKRPGRRPRES